MVKLKFLANMNISPQCVDKLKSLGWDIIRVSEVMDKKSKDIEIIEYAREHDRIIITHDLDFSMLLAIKSYRKPSVINLRLENIRHENVTKYILEVVNRLSKELSEGVVVSVDEKSARYRNLPIQIE